MVSSAPSSARSSASLLHAGSLSLLATGVSAIYGSVDAARLTVGSVRSRHRWRLGNFCALLASLGPRFKRRACASQPDPRRCVWRRPGASADPNGPRWGVHRRTRVRRAGLGHPTRRVHFQDRAHYRWRRLDGVDIPSWRQRSSVCYRSPARRRSSPVPRVRRRPSTPSAGVPARAVAHWRR